MKIADSDISERIVCFEKFVKSHFSFLETDYGLTCGKLRVMRLDEPRDASVSIRYSGKQIDVEIGWGIGNASIGINLRDNDYLEAQKSFLQDIFKGAGKISY